MRRFAKIDANQSKIVDALRQCGCAVQSLATIGKGCPDLLISRCGNIWLAEVKDGAKCPSERKLTDDEKSWHHRWKAPVHILNSVDDALAMIGCGETDYRKALRTGKKPAIWPPIVMTREDLDHFRAHPTT